MDKKITIRVRKGKIDASESFSDYVQEILKDLENDGAMYELVIRRVNKDPVSWAAHRYYRGYVLKDIADKAFDGDKRTAHLEMKKKFLFKDVSTVREIPHKHLGRCIIISETYMDEKGENRSVLKGYMPSTADLTKREMWFFTKSCEDFLFNTLQGSVSPEAIQYREIAREVENY